MASQVVDNQVWQKRQRSILTILLPQGGSGVVGSDIFVGTDTYGWPPDDEEGTQGQVIPWIYGQRINIAIQSVGPSLLTVPDVTGQSITAGTVIIARNGFNPVGVAAYNNNYPIGTIFAQSPIGGSQEPLGFTVTLFYSLGPAPAPACLPPATAQAGYGGDIWGASGGSAVPVNAYIPLAQALSTSSQPANALDAPTNRSVLSEMANGTLSADANACTVPDAPQVG